jgi:hypothetical protein
LAEEKARENIQMEEQMKAEGERRLMKKTSGRQEQDQRRAENEAASCE